VSPQSQAPVRDALHVPKMVPVLKLGLLDAPEMLCRDLRVMPAGWRYLRPAGYHDL
jgi:hypothetical protein